MTARWLFIVKLSSSWSGGVAAACQDRVLPGAGWHVGGSIQSVGVGAWEVGKSAPAAVHLEPADNRLAQLRAFYQPKRTAQEAHRAPRCPDGA